MIDYKKIFTDAIDSVKGEGRYRIFTELQYSNDKAPIAFSPSLNKNVTVWCSNDYLGMSHNPEVVGSCVATTEAMGVGSGGTRNISGNSSPLVSLEAALAKLHGKEAGLVFTSGYVSNQATLSVLPKIIKDLVIFSDELNHASMIHGIRDSRAIKEIFRHSDAAHLEELLESYPINQPKLIVFESVYSMTGDIAPIEEFIKLAKKYNAITYIDEVHSVGLYGEGGAGVVNMLGLEGQVDIVQGTLAKAYGTIGGYITASHEIIDAVRSFAPGFIFTTSLPPGIASAAFTSIKYLKRSNFERELMHQNVAKVKARFDKAGINYINNNTHIIPVVIGDPVKCSEIGMTLLKDYGIYVQPINYPTVPKGTERLRITPSPMHTEEMMDYLTDSLVSVLSAKEIKLAS